MITIKVWYPAKSVFIESEHRHKLIVPPDMIGHLKYKDALLCGKREATLVNELGMDNSKEHTTYIEGNPLCKECIEEYKTRTGFPWPNWVEGAKKTI